MRIFLLKTKETQGKNVPKTIVQIKSFNQLHISSSFMSFDWKLLNVDVNILTNVAH